MRLQFITRSLKKNVFLPEDYPNSVKGKYLPFIQWNAIQMIASSALGVLSTQQLLLAFGVNSLTASAALNWVIKDGIGQVGGILFAGRVGQRFDINIKFYRWVSAMSLNASCALEMLTPCFTGLFLPIAGLANAGKNVSCLAGSASRAAIHLNFAACNNLADITAKTGSQNTGTGLLGSTLGIMLGYMTENYLQSCILFSMLSAAHIYATIKSTETITLLSLNQQRADILLSQYLSTNILLSPEQVSSRESFLSPYKPSITVGPPLDLPNFDSSSLSSASKYIIFQHNSNWHIIFEEPCSSRDMIEGYISAYFLSKSVKVSSTEILDKLISLGWELDVNYLEPRYFRYTILKD
jgi:hypothetical protein